MEKTILEQEHQKLQAEYFYDIVVIGRTPTFMKKGSLKENSTRVRIDREVMSVIKKCARYDKITPERWLEKLVLEEVRTKYSKIMQKQIWEKTF